MPARNDKPDPPPPAADPPAVAPGRPHRTWLAIGLLALLTLAVYAPALNGGFLWDDDRYLSINPHIVGPDPLDGLRRIWFTTESPQYYPLVFTTFWIEHQLWGLNTTGYHLVNVALHVGGALLLGSLLRRANLPGAWLAAALFALHPVHVESVAWITERKNVLSCLFYLASLRCCLRFAEDGRRGAYAGALLLFVAALLSKTVTASLPVAVLLWLWWRQGRLARGHILPLIPFFAIGAALGIHTALLEQHHVGALGPDWDLTFLERVLVAGRALWFYAAKLVWPADLMFNYPRWQIDAGAPWQYLFPAAALGLGVALWLLRRRMGRGPLAACAFFAVTLAPALGFFDVYPFRFSYVADHFQYHADLGLIALLAAAVVTLLRRANAAVRSRPPGLVGLAVLLPAACGVLTFRQAATYADAETLWRATLRRNPASFLAHNNLGALLWARGDHAGAEHHYRAAIDADPSWPDARVNLGNILAARGESEAALHQFRQALAVHPSKPSALYSLARELARRGRLDEAVARYQACVDSNPDYAPCHNNLGRLLMSRGRLEEAAAHFAAASAGDPTNAEARFNMGAVLEMRGEHAAAAREYQRAIQREPGFATAYHRLGVCHEYLGDTTTARKMLATAVRLDPSLLEARAELAHLLTSTGDPEQAIEQYAALLAASPGNATARHNHAVALKSLGRYREAIDSLGDGLRAAPGHAGLMNDLARLLACCPQDDLRDGPAALSLARRVVDTAGADNPQALDTLAAALAETGDFEAAAAAAARALRAARAGGDHATADRLAHRRHLYNTGQPCREPPPSSERSSPTP